MPDLTVSYPVPYTCQFASPELVHAFLHGERALETDPNWAAYGASSPQEYAHWALRACGVVCVKMAVEGLTGQRAGPAMDWVRAGLAADGYLTEQRPDRPVEKGWKHTALARLARDHGLHACLISELALSDLVAHIRADRVIIASVTSELGEDGPLTRRSGHLVLVTGVAIDGKGGAIEAVIVHNPSGRTPDLQANARIPTARFAQGFSGRGIVIGPGQGPHIAPPPEPGSSGSRLRRPGRPSSALP